MWWVCLTAETGACKWWKQYIIDISQMNLSRLKWKNCECVSYNPLQQWRNVWLPEWIEILFNKGINLKWYILRRAQNLGVYIYTNATDFKVTQLNIAKPSLHNHIYKWLRFKYIEVNHTEHQIISYYIHICRTHRHMHCWSRTNRYLREK